MTQFFADPPRFQPIQIRDVRDRGRETIKALTEALRLAERRADEQVAELQRSRWRRIGLRLGLARKASFEALTWVSIAGTETSIREVLPPHYSCTSLPGNCQIRAEPWGAGDG